MYLEQKILGTKDQGRHRKKSIEVDKEVSNGLVDIMKEYSDKTNQLYEENSFRHPIAD